MKYLLVDTYVGEFNWSVAACGIAYAAAQQWTEAECTHLDNILVDTEVGIGTTFQFYLPLAVAQGLNSTLTRSTSIPVRYEKETLLLAEDGEVRTVLDRGASK